MLPAPPVAASPCAHCTAARGPRDSVLVLIRGTGRHRTPDGHWHRWPGARKFLPSGRHASTRSRRNPMSTAVTSAPPASSAQTRARAAIVAAVLTLGAIAVAAVVVWQPWGERDHLGYADLAPHRDAAWLGTLFDGLGYAAIGIALGLAVCMLAPGRGSTLAAT